MTMLIVEDNERVRAALRDWMQSAFSEIEVSDVADGETAVEVIKASPPDLVLMDVALPGIDGIEATRRIRVDNPDVPIVVLTIHEDGRYRQAAEEAGATAFVAKRTMQHDLVRVVGRVLRLRSEGTT